MIDLRDELGVAVAKQANGTTCIDCGVHVPGNYRVGPLFAEICLAGLATTAITMGRVDARPHSRSCRRRNARTIRDSTHPWSSRLM
ncbi:MAG TPA: methenyltetrahydromethanopterin cyclohydrolase [Methanoculleus sp.]|nr:methenyltetrahydromethanopterin cyclohydrolase [Methanoculleus sp.]